MKTFKWVCTLVLVAIPAVAQPSPAPTGFVMLPVYTLPLPGAHGSEWVTDFALMNLGSQPASYMSLNRVFPMIGFDTIRAGGYLRMNSAHISRRGRLLWVDEPQLDDFVFSLRVLDLSRNAHSAGVELPVVRKHHFRSSITLLNVPTDLRFRHSLRVYEPGLDAIDVLVRIVAESSAETIAEFGMTLVPGTTTFPIWAEPAQAEIHDLFTAYPQVRAAQSVRITIEPINADRRIWSFISVTNNVTQELTTITPQ